MDLLARRRHGANAEDGVHHRIFGAFTLIELLVVMGVIAVLAGLLMPALGMAKRKAQSVRCVNNLRQIGVGVRLYADDHAGRLPRARSGLGDTNKVMTLPAIQEVVKGYLGGESQVFRCPADREEVFQPEGSSYEWNTAVNGRILHRLGQNEGEDGEHSYLLRDREPWHPQGRRNAVFADGRAGAESS